MEHKINDWLDSFYLQNKTSNILSTASDAILQGVGKILDTPNPPFAFEEEEEEVTATFTFSFPALTGNNTEALLTKDAALQNAYNSHGPLDPTFINTLKKAPVTGLATLLSFVESMTNFIPQKGLYSIQDFGHFMQAFGSCPIVKTGSAQNLEHVSTLTKIKHDNFDQEPIVDTIVSIYNLDDEQGHAISEQLKNTTEDSVKISLYNMQLSGSSEEAFFNVYAGVVTLIRTENHKLKKTYNFKIDIKGNHINSSIETANWANFAAKLVKKHFACITEWIKSNQLPNAQTKRV